MRRLPVYLLLDTSGSMHGEPMEAVKNGVQTLITTLRQDPYALETAYVSVITFDSSARQVVPLTDLINFKSPDLVANGTTALGEALSLVAQAIEREVQKTTAETKGDWRPLVFIMTDGAPTDDWRKGVDDFTSARTGVVVACAAGQVAETKVLQEITEIVLQLDTADSNAIKAFFKWVSASISVGSQKVESGKKEVIGLDDLPPPPPEVNVVL
ncbi:vWA domain-containing protein [Pectobacterium parmentieri]|uniref:vWA domain-containing protein n=1 Tax=Pectobacterium parmentieri TaxID=1905730 RepID=UPI0018DF9314|nr:VWA domain-containing protein [Pectobacterium parmentieri]MBI0549049.1 VWA domain-containing protein [Pectobacterium parmentieri]MBI0558069.1 VWA domain-containing protein [Pectobacterium parmentieri]MBI0562122.1 VWA domain-containing protein [Pectobacterium parmentieri]